MTINKKRYKSLIIVVLLGLTFSAALAGSVHVESSNININDIDFDKSWIAQQQQKPLK